MLIYEYVHQYTCPSLCLASTTLLHTQYAYSCVKTKHIYVHLEFAKNITSFGLLGCTRVVCVALSIGYA
jgi:hypothetical protein